MTIKFNPEEIALTIIAVKQAIDKCIDDDLGTQRLNSLEELLDRLEYEVRITQTETIRQIKI